MASNFFRRSARLFATHAHRGAHPPPVSGRIKTSHALSAAVVTSLATYTIGAFNPPNIVSYIAPRPAPPPPDPAHPVSVAYVDALEQELNQLPYLQRLREDPDWYESRPYDNYPEEKRVNSLTAGALKGLGKLALMPLVRAKNDETESYVFIHVGRGLCGHDGIIHGGLLATLLDEALARTAILNFPEKIGVTANLTVDYKAPTKADQFIVIHTKLVEVKGRKAVVSGRVEDLDGNLLVESRATFVQPKYAKLLNSSAVTKALGAPRSQGNGGVQPDSGAK